MSKNDLSKIFYYTNPPYWPADQTQGLKISTCYFKYIILSFNVQILL